MATTLAAVLVVSVVGILMIGPPLTSSSAAMQQERTLETKYIREHLPIRVKIKKEKEESFKDSGSASVQTGFAKNLSTAQ